MDQPLKDHAEAYVEQIQNALNIDAYDQAEMLLKEFGKKAYHRGWKAACDQIASEVEMVRSARAE